MSACAGIFRNGIILPSCVYIRAYIEQPGVVAETGSQARLSAAIRGSGVDHTPYFAFLNRCTFAVPGRLWLRRRSGEKICLSPRMAW